MSDPAPDSKAHEAGREEEARTLFESLMSDWNRPYREMVGLIEGAIREAEERGAARLLGADSTLTVNVLRSWEPKRIESFALHLLGDRYAAAIVALKEWRAAELAHQKAISVSSDSSVYSPDTADRKVKAHAALRAAADALEDRG